MAKIHVACIVLAVLGSLTGCIVAPAQGTDPNAGPTFASAAYDPTPSARMETATAELPTPTAEEEWAEVVSTRTSPPIAVELNDTRQLRDAGAGTRRTINPLTGLPVDDPALLERRPMVIKISNYPRDIRPQFGLNEADVVFEYYIEWGYTRFIGVFYSRDARQIGPVRSGRYFDEHIMRMYQAYYVFNYADPREFNYFLGGDIQPFMVVPGYGACPPFFQDEVSSLIYDVRHYETYFDSTRFGECLARKSADNTRPQLRGTLFSARTPPAGAEVKRIFTYFSRCDYNYWEYDQSTSRYLRYQEGSPSTKPRDINACSDNPRTYVRLTDSVTDKAVYADNLAVIYVPYTYANAGEQADEIYHIDLMDSGRAYVFRDGLAWPARWVRSDIDQPLMLTTPAGEPFALRPGRTFFEVLGETSDAWSDGSDWQFEFHTP